MDLKVDYIYHSGFTLEGEDFYLIFDYYKGKIDLRDKKTYVFVSHGHQDHYNEEIFSWQRDIPNIEYIISSDIDLDKKGKNIHILDPYQALDLEDLRIETFGSTDLGVSFLLSIRGINIFHSGDLNWWHWESNSQEDNENEERIYKEEIEKLLARKIDLAFVPVDPRLGPGFYYGGKYFIEKLRPKYFFPMHFGDRPEISRNFMEKVSSEFTRIMPIDLTNQSFYLQGFPV